MCMDDNSLIPRPEHKIWEWGSYRTYPATDMKAVDCLSSVTDVHHWGPTTKAETSECGLRDSSNLGMNSVDQKCQECHMNENIGCT